MGSRQWVAAAGLQGQQQQGIEVSKQWAVAAGLHGQQQVFMGSSNRASLAAGIWRQQQGFVGSRHLAAGQEAAVAGLYGQQAGGSSISSGISI